MPIASSRAGARRPRARHRILCDASDAEIRELRRVLGWCFTNFAISSPPPQCLKAGARLVDHSNFRTVRSILSVNSARAVTGLHWLCGFELLQGLANHLARHDHPDDSAAGLMGLGIWEETLYLASTAEMLARATGHCRPLEAWLCSLLLGAANVAKALRSLESNEPPYGTTLDVARLLCQFERETELALPDPRSAPVGPWHVVSAAQHLVSHHDPVLWATHVLSRIAYCAWPEVVETVLEDRLVVARQFAAELGRASWRFALQTS